MRRRLFDNEAFCGLLFVAPALIGFTLFYLLPTIRAFYIGLTNWNLLRAPKFLGFDNYVRLMGDGKFWSSIWITVLYVLYNIPVQTVLGLLMAVLLKRLTGSVFIRSVMLAPFLISNVIAAMIWFWMLDPVLGILNFLFQAMGLGSHAFFSDEQLALPTIAAINVSAPESAIERTAFDRSVRDAVCAAARKISALLGARPGADAVTA